jgi:hypothetical protein
MSFSQTCVGGAVRTLNLGGRALRRLGVEPPSIEAESLYRAACRRAGSSDFGAWNFAEPLERLLKSYRDEAKLTTLGRITVRELLVSLLDNLLRMGERSDRASSSNDRGARVHHRPARPARHLQLIGEATTARR